MLVLLLVGLGLAAAPAGPAHAAIAFDTVTTFGVADCDPCEWTHTVTAGGADRILVVSFGYRDPPNPIVGVTYNGIALTEIRTEIFPTRRVTSMWYLLNPPTGTPFTVSVDLTAAANQRFSGASASYTGVDQTTPVEAGHVGGQGTSATSTVDITTTTPNAWIVDSHYAQDDWTMVAKAGRTQRWNFKNGSFTHAGSTLETTSAGTFTMDWTEDTATSQFWVVVAAALRPALTGICPGGVVTTTADSTTGGSLRACIIWANGTPGADTLAVPAGTYTLTIAGTGENVAATGDFDITDNLTLNGDAVSATIIDANAIDRVFDVLGASATFSNLTIRNGNTGGKGGGINLDATASVTLSASTVSGNTGGDGGGIATDGGTVDLTNVTVSGNTADDGAGLHCVGPCTLTNVTVSGNTATGIGAGLNCEAPCTATFLNTIVANNGGPDCGGNPADLVSNGNNLSSDATCDFTSAGDQENTDPLLGPLHDNGGPTFTHELLAGSPAIEGGTNTGCPATDQRGIARPIGVSCDIGSYEAGASICPGGVVTTTVDSTTGGSLRACIIWANGTPGADTLAVPAGTYTLTIAGTGEDAAATGDLDITDDLTLNGNAASATIIDANSIDRVFEILGASATMSNLTIRNGNVTGDGAGISIDPTGSLTLSNSTVSGNTVNGSNDGGGIHASGTTADLTNVTVSGNTADRAGGLDCAGPCTLTNVTVTANTAPTTGGGVRQRTGSGSITFLNTIVANNSSGGAVDCDGNPVLLFSNGNNLSSDATCDFTSAGDQENTDPLLGPLQDNGGPTFTHELLAGSPAIEGGTNTGCPATDQRGIARPVNPSCDIGAYEAEFAPLTLTKTAFWPDGTPIPTGVSIPSGVEFKYLLYINNPGIARSDITVRDVLDAAFQYQAGTIQVDNSVGECALAVCTAAEELTIFTAVDGAAFLTDAADGDVGSYTGPSTSVDAGNENVANLQLDINATAVWAMLFSAKML